MQRLHDAQPREPRHAADEDQPASRHLHRSAGTTLRVGPAVSSLTGVEENVSFALIEVCETFTYNEKLTNETKYSFM